MKRLYLLVITLLVGTVAAYSQTSNCTQTLRLMRSTYEQGRLHELGSQSEGCLNAPEGKGFTKEEKREAYRLITLSWIYLEEPEKADASMLQLLNSNHFYEINKAVDPAEFIALYNKFRKDPLYWINFKFAFNAAHPVVMNYYNIGSDGGTHGTYVPKLGIQALVAFEKPISKKIAAAPEIGYVNRSYGYKNSSLSTSDEDPSVPVSTQEFAISQSWLDLNAIFNYKVKDNVQLKTYFGAGPSISYLLSSTNQPKTVLGNGFTVTGSAVDDSGSYNKLVYSFSLLAGAKIKFADFYVMGDVRYQIGLVNAVNPATRTNPELGFDYQGAYNDYRMNNLMINVGISYPVFKPKKLVN